MRGLQTYLPRLRRAQFKLKGWLRRQRESRFPDAETRAYRRWIFDRIAERGIAPLPPIEPGLLSIVTAVWDGTPPPYFERLAASISTQNANGECQWIIVDNGCRRAEMLRVLQRLRLQPSIKIVSADKNLGIVKALRLGLETATGRYIAPVDADDDLYPSSLALAANFIRKHNFPLLLYSDEDKVIGGRHSQPYFKPDFDPVLLANSAYIAHLGIFDREKALALNAYSSQAVEGSVDWDLFLRFLSAGIEAVHIPEVLYQWRIHSESTADDSAAKSYIGSSQRSALRGFLDRHPNGRNFSIVESPLLPGGAHFRLLRSSTIPPPASTVIAWQQLPGFPALRGVQNALKSLSPDVQQVCLVDADLKIDDPDWTLEAAGVRELFPDTVAVGGRLRNSDGKVVAADQHFGFGGACASPNTGRSAADPGYFGQMFKQRSCSAVSAQMIAVDRKFLEAVLPRFSASASAYDFAAWLGVTALEHHRRVVYSPYISGVTDNPWSARIAPEPPPDRRFYPEPLSLSRAFHIG